jgi:hypothetical protein
MEVQPGTLRPDAKSGQQQKFWKKVEVKMSELIAEFKGTFKR